MTRKKVAAKVHSEPREEVSNDGNEMSTLLEIEEPSLEVKAEVMDDQPTNTTVENPSYYIGALPQSEPMMDKDAPETRVEAIEGEAVPERSMSYYIGAVPVMEEAGEAELPEAEAPKTGFGWVELNGRRYEFDVVVHTDGKVTKRDKSLSKRKKAKYGHTPVTRKELKLLEKEKPSTIIIGTGQSGALPLTPKAERVLENYAYFVGRTPLALEKLASESGRKVAIIHVTC